MSARGLLCGSRARTAPRRRAAALGSYRRTRVWLSPPQLSRDVARRGGPLLLVLFSRPVRRSARAPLLRSTRAPAGGVRTTSGRADARRARRDGRGARGVQARRALGTRDPRFRAPGVGFAALLAPRSARAALSLRARPVGSLRTSAQRTRRAARATCPARGEPARRALIRVFGVNPRPLL